MIIGHIQSHLFKVLPREGLHFITATVGKWKLIEQHHAYLNKHPGKSYCAIDGPRPLRSTLEQQMTRLGVRTRRSQRERQDRKSNQRKFHISNRFFEGPTIVHLTILGEKITKNMMISREHYLQELSVPDQTEMKT